MSTSEQHYRSNLRDTFFNLFEVLEIQKTTLGHGEFAGLDEETVRATLSTYEEFCRKELAPSWAISDRVPLELDKPTGTVRLPAALTKSLRIVLEQGWPMLGLPERLGGTGAPPSVAWAAFELTAGANATAAFYLLGDFIARTIDRLGTPAQKKRFVESMLKRHWGGSMVLTEPDAGSDVGAGRSKARHLHDDVWEIEGVKRFITNGDFDAAENIVHLVLARPEGAGPGTKGLSMFIVPKYWVNEDGSLGERNGVYCTNIEHKMGIKASATCELTFGERHPARGLLVGEVHDGIRQMFHVIEYARMAVGCKSMATLSTAYLNALEFAKLRVQGPDLLRATDKTAPRVRILQHPDVRRMLMTQKAHAEGMRALCLFTASVQDQVELGGGHDNRHAAALDSLNDLLLPLVKGYCSEKAYEILAISLQTFGGSGYCQDYPIEQYIRDQKIDSLYEGTTHIQALDLLLRKVGRDGGQTLRGLLGRAEATLKEIDPSGPLGVEHAALSRALGDLQGIFGTLMGKLGESLYHAGFQGNRILMATAEVVIGWLLVRQAVVAHAQRETAAGPDRDFYTGKLAAVRFYVRNVLPGVSLTRKIVEQSTLELMEIPEEGF
ncbi:MAG TPA: acyl-CoA dehydrogenase [Polyangia bacterium]|nr:acyl-CoA dehydrogenase [Polyangia bacterium]